MSEELEKTLTEAEKISYELKYSLQDTFKLIKISKFELFDDTKFDSGRLYLVFDLIPNQNSEIHIYNVFFQKQGTVEYEQLPDCVLNAQKIGFNSFSVDSLETIHYTYKDAVVEYLAIGVMTYGLVTVDVS
jgi:hypothetical protein